MRFLFFYQSILSFLHISRLISCITIFIRGFFNQSIVVFRGVISYLIRYFLTCLFIVSMLINAIFDLSLQRSFHLYVHMFQYRFLFIINLWLDHWKVFTSFTPILLILRNFYKVRQIASIAKANYFPSLINLSIQLT